MDIISIIRTKRDGGELSEEQIRWAIEHYSSGDNIADEQMSALLMAIVWRGMEPTELATWTAAMIESGARLDLGPITKPTVDKHSTGGVGDKLSLTVVPMLAACGAAVPQLSGRGLGHTGGTLDKMEAIPGWTAELDHEHLIDQLQTTGGIIAGASRDLVPADRKLYALRDVTGTVESIPLIASSIMSKKIAEGTESLVLDVKVGRGAFLPSLEQARELASTMVDLGYANGVRTSAVLTNMDCVLGRAAGNALEVSEALDVLRGQGPEDVVDLSIHLAQEMASLAGINKDPADTLSSGAALDSFTQMVEAQGGSLSEPLPTAPHIEQVESGASGTVQSLDPFAVGIAAWRLGAGRSRKEDPVSPSAGVMCLAKPGERVEVGQPIFELHTDQADRIGYALQSLEDAVVVGAEAPKPTDLVHEYIRRS